MNTSPWPSNMPETLMFIGWLLWCLTIPGNLVVQIIGLVRSSGFLRWVAAVPLLFMVPCYILFVIGISQGGDNLSWLLLILPSPLAFLYVVVIAFFVRQAAKHLPSAT